MEDKAATQHNRQYDWLKPYQWKKGQSGNPAGGKRGKTLKTFVKELLEEMPEEEKIDFLKTLKGEFIWEMAEGKPKQTLSGESGEPIIVKIIKNGDNTAPQLPSENIPEAPNQ